MNKNYEKIVSLVCDTLVEAGSTFREDKKKAYKRVIASEDNERAKWVLGATQNVTPTFHFITGVEAKRSFAQSSLPSFLSRKREK